MHDINLRLLRTFLEVAQAQSVSQAAQVLHITQPALSRRLQQLEAELGVRLFDRARRRMRLTAEGSDLLVRCRDLMSAFEALRSRAGAIHSGRTGVLRVGATAMTLEGFVAPFLKRFRRLRPQVEVRLVEDGGMRLVERLQRGELQLALTLPVAERLRATPLFPTYLLAVMPDDHRLARRKDIEIGELAGERILALHAEFMTRQLFSGACRLERVQTRIVMEGTAPRTLVALARAGAGVAIIPSNQRLEKSSVAVAPILHRGKALGDWMCVIRDPSRTLPSYGEEFIEMLRAYAKRSYPGREFRTSRPPRTPADVC